MTTKVSDVLRELLTITRDVLPEGDDYSDGTHCDECGTARENDDQTQCDVPGCFYVRARRAIANAEAIEKAIGQ